MEQQVANTLNEPKEKNSGGGVLKKRIVAPSKKGTCKTFLMACCCCKTDNTVYLPLDKTDLDASKRGGKGVNFADNSAVGQSKGDATLHSGSQDGGIEQHAPEQSVGVAFAAGEAEIMGGEKSNQEIDEDDMDNTDESDEEDEDI